MRLFSKLAAALILATGATIAGQARAAMPITTVPHAAGASALQDVRWEQRCHREMGRDRFGRRAPPRRVCERVWVGPRR